MPKLRTVKQRSHYRKNRRTLCGLKSTEPPPAVPEDNENVTTDSSLNVSDSDMKIMSRSLRIM